MTEANRRSEDDSGMKNEGTKQGKAAEVKGTNNTATPR